MNVSRRICCNAANAFRPAHALKNIFFEPIGIRFASRTSSEVTPEFEFEFGQLRRHQAPKQARTTRKNVTVDASKQESLAQKLDVAAVDGYEPQSERADAKELGKQSLEQADGIESHEVQSQDVVSGGIKALGESDEESNDSLQKPITEDANHKATFQSPKLAEIAGKKIAGQTKEVLEYEGQYVRPVTRARVDIKRLPWLQGLYESQEVSRMERQVYSSVGYEASAYTVAEWALKSKLLPTGSAQLKPK
jgi:hypothetical protein